MSALITLLGALSLQAVASALRLFDAGMTCSAGAVFDACGCFRALSHRSNVNNHKPAKKALSHGQYPASLSVGTTVVGKWGGISFSLP